MQTHLAGKVALVCAASRGLGKAAALSLAAEGAKVAICARHADTLDAAAFDIRTSTGADVMPVPADLSQAAGIERLIEQVVAKWGGIDVLVTNAGGPPPGTSEVLSEEDWRSAFETLLMSVVRLCRGVVPVMRRRGGGRIINITSISAKQPIDRLMLSNSLRPAVHGFSKTLAGELAAENIQVNCVAPGYTRTERVVELTEEVARRSGGTREEAEQRLVADIPARRLGEPDELASLITFLASDRAKYITGATIAVDGGFIRGLL
jgi:3-oxoacyl-[acyl-carrier protein] reductase